MYKNWKNHFFKSIRCCSFVLVFHRILDFKRGWIFILALFYFIPLILSHESVLHCRTGR